MRQIKLEFEAALPENFPCHFIFKWTSYQVCPSFARKVITESQKHSESHEKILTSQTNSKTGLVLIVLVFSIVSICAFYLRLPENRERLHENIRRIKIMCQRNQDEQEHNLLFQSNVNIPTFGDLDDDEDLIIA